LVSFCHCNHKEEGTRKKEEGRRPFCFAQGKKREEGRGKKHSFPGSAWERIWARLGLELSTYETLEKE